MWEWSNKILKKGFEKKAPSLLQAYDGVFKKDPAIIKPYVIENQPQLKPQTISLEEMKVVLEERLHDLKLSNMHLELKAYEPQTWKEMAAYYHEFNKVRKVYLKLLGYNHERECLEAGLSHYDVRLLKQSQAPENYNIHIKIPADFGGELDFSNMSLIKTYPTHLNIHNIIDYQIGMEFLRVHKKIFVPYFIGNFYHD